MSNPTRDDRSPEHRARDEAIVAEPRLFPPDFPADAASEALEVHLSRQARRPLAIAGIVENGLVRPLDRSIKLTESSRVIIVTTESP